MGLKTITIICPHCDTANQVSAEDPMVNGEIRCSKCHGMVGLLKDFDKRPSTRPQPDGALEIQFPGLEDPKLA